jgi:hypothetical protein
VFGAIRRDKNQLKLVKQSGKKMFKTSRRKILMNSDVEYNMRSQTNEITIVRKIVRCDTELQVVLECCGRHTRYNPWICRRTVLRLPHVLPISCACAAGSNDDSKESGNGLPSELSWIAAPPKKFAFEPWLGGRFSLIITPRATTIETVACNSIQCNPPQPPSVSRTKVSNFHIRAHKGSNSTEASLNEIDSPHGTVRRVVLLPYATCTLCTICSMYLLVCDAHTFNNRTGKKSNTSATSDMAL